MKTYTRLVSVVLAVLMLCASAVSASALEYTAKEAKLKGFRFTSDAKSVTITGVARFGEKEIIIPDKIDGKEVTKVETACTSDSDVESITVPESVKYLSSFTALCRNLKTVTINANLTNVTYYAFRQLNSLNTVIFKSYEDGKMTFTPGNNVGDGDVKNDNEVWSTFYDCPKLETVVIPYGVKVLKRTFEKCPSLTNLYLPSTITNMSNAFTDGFDKSKLTVYTYSLEGEKNAVIDWCNTNGVKCVNFADTKPLTITSKSLKAGAAYTIPVNEAYTAKFAMSSNNYVKLSKNKVTALNKGSATVNITVMPKYYDIAKYLKSYKVKVSVTTAPTISKTSVTVKKGKTVSVKLTGKASTIANKYTNTKIAKITSATKDTAIKIKGLKKGTTTLKVKVNGVKTLSVKVKVN